MHEHIAVVASHLATFYLGVCFGIIAMGLCLIARDKRDAGETL